MLERCLLVCSLALFLTSSCSESANRPTGDGGPGSDRGAPGLEAGVDANSDANTPADSGPPTPKKPCGPTYPQQQCGAAVDGKTWAFNPGTDVYATTSLLDLRDLNEKQAGETGFIKLSADGNDFVKGDGSPIRFWAINTTVYRKDDTTLADHARFIAKRGVNMVRWHGQIPSKDKSAPLGEIDTEARDQLWRLVAAMKKEGIYVTLSPYWANPGVASVGKNLHGHLFVDDTLEAAYKSWLDKLLKPKNPYTGVALKDEPALAIVQLQNEDSLLFWTVNNLIKGPLADKLSKLFASWLKDKYGDLNKAEQAWKSASVNGDDLQNDLPRFYNVWEMTQKQTAGSGKDLRLADQLQFWTESMRAFNSRIVDHLRKTIGAKQLVNAGNWKSADPLRLNDAERYSYTAAEIIGVNRYYNGGVHEGQYRGWAIVNGDRFTNRSVLLDPRALPLSVKQVAGHPTIIPENNWVPPLGYQSEGPFLASVMMSLTGVDALYWFNVGEAQFRQPSSANGYLPSIGKWVAATPEIMGNFPAAALMYRKGYIARGKPVVQEKRKLSEMWSRAMPIISESASFDPNRDSADISPDSNIPGGVDPLAFLAGPVEVSYDADSSKSQVADLSKLIYDKEQVVCSITGQLSWDTKNGVATINAPRAQGVTGFLSKRGRFELDDVTIESCNAYATVYVVSMDGAPLARSAQILVQTGTVARPTGWKQKAASWKDGDGKTVQGFEIVDYGKAPWQIVESDITLTIENSAISKAVVLDLHGVPLKELPLARQGASATLKLPADAKYLILR
jgi:hypothetical protein